jgi:ribosomal-protein-alanine N-acetyltransferase
MSYRKIPFRAPAAALATARLDLEPLARDDAPELFALFAAPEVCGFSGLTPLTSLAAATRLLEGELAAIAADERRQWALRRRTDRAFVGLCGLKACFAGDDGPWAELAFHLLPAHWGRGLMSEALAAIGTFAREVLGVPTVAAMIRGDNHRAINMVLRTGFAAPPRAPASDARAIRVFVRDHDG